jgi:hypothetical protein
MLLYLMRTEQSGAAEEHGIAGYPLYGGDKLPVFTSPESLAGGLKSCASSLQDSDYIGFEIMNPFELSEMLGFFGRHGLQSLLFDPPPAPQGEVWIIGSPIPVGEYRRAIEEFRPEFEKLSAEALDEFCSASHLVEEPFVRWPFASIEEIAADLRARIEEHLL